MKKTFVVIAIVVGVIVLGCVFAGLLGAFDTPLERYAPEEADLIVYVNARKIAAHKISKTLLDHDIVKDQLDRVQDLTDVPAEDLLNGEVCVFVDTRSFNGSMPRAAAVARFRNFGGGMPQKLMDLAEEKSEEYRFDDKLTPTKLDGKRALALLLEGKSEDESATAIALNRCLLQIAYDPEGEWLGALSKSPATDLTRKIDTSALISAAWRPDRESRAKLNEFLRNARDWQGISASDLKFVSARLLSRGGKLELQAELTFKRPASAKKVELRLKKKLRGTRIKMELAAERDRKERGRDNDRFTEKDMLLRVLENAKIERRNAVVKVTVVDDVDELCDIINEYMESRWM